MQVIFDAFNLAGPSGDLKVMVLALLALGLIMAGTFMIARVIGIRLGGLTMIDLTYFGYGVAMPLVGYIVGASYSAILDVLNSSGGGYDSR